MSHKESSIAPHQSESQNKKLTEAHRKSGELLSRMQSSAVMESRVLSLAEKGIFDFAIRLAIRDGQLDQFLVGYTKGITKRLEFMWNTILTQAREIDSLTPSWLEMQRGKFRDSTTPVFPPASHMGQYETGVSTPNSEHIIRDKSG